MKTSVTKFFPLCNLILNSNYALTIKDFQYLHDAFVAGQRYVLYILGENSEYFMQCHINNVFFSANTFNKISLITKISYVITELLQSDLHKIIVSPQHLSADHIKVFLYQILRGLFNISLYWNAFEISLLWVRREIRESGCIRQG